MKKTSKILALALSCLLSVGLGVGLAGCSQNEEAAIKGQLEGELDSLKKATPDDMEEMMGEDAVASMKEYGIDPTDFYDAMFGKFDYKTNSVTVDGDKAEVSLTVTNVDIKTATENFETSFTKWAETDEATELYLSDGEAGIMKKALEMYIDELKSSDLDPVTDDVMITLTKGSDGTWEVDDKDNIANVLFAGADLQAILG